MVAGEQSSFPFSRRERPRPASARSGAASAADFFATSVAKKSTPFRLERSGPRRAQSLDLSTVGLPELMRLRASSVNLSACASAQPIILTGVVYTTTVLRPSGT